ncbi:MAG: DUF1254 domain-containing protein [Hyphomicrobiaceae bacterium]
MTPRLLIFFLALSAITHCTFMVQSAIAQNTTPGFNTKIPESVLTPDKVETRIGTLEFFDGIPDEKSAKALFANLDLNRGVQAFLNGMPASNFEAGRSGHIALGQKNANQAIIFDGLMDSNSLFLTGNAGTVYFTSFLDLERDGPTVVEIPGGSGPGIMIDSFSRNIIDMGPPGPHRGKGGKFLVLPPGYVAADFEGIVPKGVYTIASSRSYAVWVLLRGFLKDGKPDYSSQLFRKGIKVYPLRAAADPLQMEWIEGTGKDFNTIHSANFHFFEELHSVIDREPLQFLDPELRGLFSSIGIEKGKPFAPDDRMKKILEQSARLGNATVRALFWYERDKSEFLYKGSYWKRGMIGNSHEYLKDQGLGGRNIDARAQYFYMATFNSPAMVWKLIGRGSQYAWGYLDSNGRYLDGGKSYKLNLPANAPAEKFMSIVVYDSQTRSMIQTSQRYPSKNNKRDKLHVNQDGSIDIFFSPMPPKGKEANWIETRPNKGWFCLLRLYSPTEDWFDKTLRPGEIELIN